MNRALVLTITAICALGGLVAACPSQKVDVALNGKIPNDTTDCPGPYFKISVPTDGGSVYQDTVLIAGRISKVPEFHDCQRFISATTGTYSDLFAIFASFRLDSIDEVLDSLNALNQPNQTFVAVAAAEIYTRTGTYGDLGIKPGFSCLYLTDHDSWRQAYVVSTGWMEKDCRQVLDINGSPPAGTTILKVSRTTIGGLNDPDYPRVARWQVSADHKYTIGIKCGPAYCLVGGADSGPIEQAGSYTSGDAVHMVGGWYDEQELAVANPTTNSLMPSGIRGHAEPVAGLGAMINPITFDTGYVHVGDIELHSPEGPYYSKLGLRQGTNRLFLKGRLGEPIWQAMIIAPNGEKTFRHVRRHGHDGQGIEIPGTLRWRWLPKDETIWARCLEGCCQVQDS